MLLSEAVKKRILVLLEERKINLHKLCLNSGIPYSTLSSFLYGRTRTPNLATILHICEGFNMDLVDFFDDKIFKNVEED